MKLTAQHVRLGNFADKTGALIFDGDILLAVVSQLSSEHGVLAGGWFLECAFGVPLENDDIFPDLPAACAWIEQRLSPSLPSPAPTLRIVPRTDPPSSDGA